MILLQDRVRPILSILQLARWVFQRNQRLWWIDFNFLYWFLNCQIFAYQSFLIKLGVNAFKWGVIFSFKWYFVDLFFDLSGPEQLRGEWIWGLLSVTLKSLVRRSGFLQSWVLLMTHRFWGGQGAREHWLWSLVVGGLVFVEEFFVQVAPLSLSLVFLGEVVLLWRGTDWHLHKQTIIVDRKYLL